jgi:hypothetical protein
VKNPFNPLRIKIANGGHNNKINISNKLGFTHYIYFLPLDFLLLDFLPLLDFLDFFLPGLSTFDP